LCIHEVLERRISSLLEFHVVLETFLQHLVHLELQVQKLLRKLNRLLKKLLILHDLFTTRLDVRDHFLDDEVKCLDISFEDFVHEGEFIKVAVGKHVVTPSRLFD